MNKINFALVTSNSLMDKVPSWESYQSMEEEQFLDLINYSKELVNSDSEHKITFLVVAQGLDETEEQESKEKLKQEELAAQDLEYQKSLRSKSKSIINSIYGI